MILKYKSRTGLNISRIQKKMKETAPQQDLIMEIAKEYKTGEYWYDHDLISIVKKLVNGYGKSLTKSKVRQAFMIAENELKYSPTEEW